MRTYIQTIDVDNGNKKYLERILQKIASKKCCMKLQYRLSTSLSHYHIRIECSKECDLCKLVFDDSARYTYDQERPKRRRGILHNEATIIINSKVIKLKASEWITVKDINNRKPYKQLKPII